MTTLTVKPCKKHGDTEFYKNGVCKKCTYDSVKKRRESKLKSENICRRLWAKNNKYSISMVKHSIESLTVFISGGLKKSDIPPELVEIKRLQMQLNHAIKEKKRLLLEA